MQLIEILKKPTITEKEIKEKYEFTKIVAVGLLVNIFILLSAMHENFSVLMWMFSFSSIQISFQLNKQIKNIQKYKKNKIEIKNEIFYFMNSHYDIFLKELEILIKSKKTIKQKEENFLEKISLKRVLQEKMNDFICLFN